MPDTGSGLVNFVMRGQQTSPAEVEKYFRNPAAASFPVRARLCVYGTVRLDAQEPGEYSFEGELCIVRTGDVMIGGTQESAVTIYYNPRTRVIISRRPLQTLILR